MSLQEASLIEQSKAGNIDSFEQLILAHQKKAFNIAYRILGNLEDANDVTQEALLKAYKGISKFNAKSSFSTWLYTIVTNTSMDFIRKNRKTIVTYLDREYETEEGSYKTQVYSDQETPEEILEKKEVQKLVNDAIEQLSDEHRKIIVLRDIQQFSYQEIAQILNCSEGTVKSRINRARNNLKILIKEKLDD
ncbi:RNA polymerase sigma factor [Alkaliphilus oremlandii]|uniref:RNA polymerase, sigma-24 subunit, ECF subfamily n=1 Tax=Alkaliphilus oremlandii (strain OhILAs) TaxID=350688 RepID=A8MF81_ALKOO|nr:sigma-70 family RNA polymerase sigma factor [Alkaliphilus oremlandii]ABW18750.1 RNA polymerase, sigma-24 subunit, ECF subfamily [Alkaliphilus oremlandii OhILAs]